MKKSHDKDQKAERDRWFIIQESNTSLFVLELTTVLKCLKKAEEKKVLPELPADWWNEAMNYSLKTQFLIVPESGSKSKAEDPGPGE
jgi:hypothetical protein